MKTWTDLGESDWSETEFVGARPARRRGLDARAGSRRSRPTTSRRGSGPPTSSPAPSGSTARSPRPGCTRPPTASTRRSSTARRVGDVELTPGWTAYRIAAPGADLRRHRPARRRRQRHRRAAQRRLVARPEQRRRAGSTTTAPPPRSSLQLDVTLAVGRDDRRSAPTAPGGRRRATSSRADLIAGEVHDLRRRARLGRTGRRGTPVRVEDHGYDRARRASPAPPVRRIEELRPASVRELAPGRWVVDVGQNINGWVRLRRLGPAGTEITLTYGEWLDDDGDVTQDHVAYPASTEVERTRAVPGRRGHLGRRSTATCSSPATAPRASSTSASRATTDRSPPTTSPPSSCTPTSTAVGGFACSDERINALHRIAEWSFRDNACDIPTDCPTRERAGWTGDWQIFVETAAFLYDVGGFSVKWLRDLAAEQRPDGKVTNLVPESHPGDDRPPGHLAAHRGLRRVGRRRRPRALGAPTATTGDRQVLADQWASMQAWVDYAADAAATGRHPSRVERSRRAAPARAATSGTAAGTSASGSRPARPSTTPSPPPWSPTTARSPPPTSTARPRQLAEIARHPRPATTTPTRYAELAANVADAWRTEFLADDGTTTPDTQATYARALTFGLIPDDLRAASADRLVELIRDAGTHLSTGFLATPVPAPGPRRHRPPRRRLRPPVPGHRAVVARHGRPRRHHRVGGVGRHRRRRRAARVAQPLQQGRGHLVPAPVRRRPPARSSPATAASGSPRGPAAASRWAEAHHDSPYGRIEVRWEQHDGPIELEVTVPPGTTAEVRPARPRADDADQRTPHRLGVGLRRSSTNWLTTWMC